MKNLFHICPHSEIVTLIFGLLFAPTGTFSIFLITRSPSMTLKTENVLKIQCNVTFRLHINAVKPGYNAYHWDPKIVAAVDRLLLLLLMSYIVKNPIWAIKMVII